MSKYIKGKERMKHEKKKKCRSKNTPDRKKREQKGEQQQTQFNFERRHKMLIKLSECIAPFGEGNWPPPWWSSKPTQNPLQSLVLKQLAQSQPILCNM